MEKNKAEITNAVCNLMSLAGNLRAEKEKDKKKPAKQQEGQPQDPLHPLKAEHRQSGLYPTLVDIEEKTPPPPYVPGCSDNNPFQEVPQPATQAPTLNIKREIVEIEEQLQRTAHSPQ